MKKTFYRKLFAGLMLLAAVAATASAQPNRTSKFLVLTTYHVKPAANADFADFLKNKWMPAMKKGGGSPRIYSATPVGGDANVYVIGSYMDSLAMFDNPITTLEKGAGAGPYARMMAQRAQMIEQRHQTILTRQADMSVYGDGATNSPLLLVQYAKTEPGKQPEFREHWVKEIVPAVKKAGRTVSVWRVTFGDELQFVTTTPLQSFAELDKGMSIAQLAMEPAAYKTWNDAVQPIAAGVRREVLRLRKDLMSVE